MANPFIEVPAARRRLVPAAIVGVATSTLCFLIGSSVGAVLLGETPDSGGVVDVFLVLGPGMLLYYSAAALLVLLPSVLLWREGSALSLWHVLLSGAVCGVVATIMFGILARGVLAGLCGAVAAWAVVVWPSWRTRVAV